MPRASLHRLGQQSHRSPAAAVEVDWFTVSIPHIARTQSLRRLDVEIGDDGVRLLHQEPTGRYAIAENKESYTPESASIVHLGLESSLVADYLMCAIWKEVAFLPDLEQRHGT